MMTQEDQHAHAGNGLTSGAMDDVGVMLRRLRVRARLTQEALATLAHVGQKTISQIETGRRPTPSPIVLGRLDAVLEAGGALLETLERSRDDQTGMASVLAQLDAIAARLAQLEKNTAALTRRLEAGGQPAEDVRQWVLTLAAYGESMTEAERGTLISLARQLADKHSPPTAT